MTDAERLTMALYRGALEDLIARVSATDGFTDDAAWLRAYVISRVGEALRSVEALNQ